MTLLQVVTWYSEIPGSSPYYNVENRYCELGFVNLSIILV